MMVVFDAGQNSAAIFAHLAGTGLRYVGSVPASDCAGLTGLAASARAVVDEDRFGELTAFDTRREVYGTGRRAILTHSPELHEKQARGFTGTTFAKAGRKLDELAATLARGKTRRPRPKVEAEIARILHDPWARRVITWQLTGDTPKDHRLTWHIDSAAHAALEEEIFGKHVLTTDHDDWPAAEVIAAYRSQSEAEEASFWQMKDPRAASFSPMFHWTERNIVVHVFTCVLALQLAHLMRRRAARVGLDLSLRALLAELADTGETVLLYPATAAGPGPTACSPTPPRPGQAHKDLRTRPLRPQALTWVIRNPAHTPMLTSANTAKINLSRKVRLGALSGYCSPSSPQAPCLVWDSGRAVDAADITEHFSQAAQPAHRPPLTAKAQVVATLCHPAHHLAAELTNLGLLGEHPTSILSDTT